MGVTKDAKIEVYEQSLVNNSKIQMGSKMKGLGSRGNYRPRWVSKIGRAFRVS